MGPGNRGTVIRSLSPWCPKAPGADPAEMVMLVGPHTATVPQQQRPGAALPEAPGPEPVSFLLTEGGCEKSQEQGECDMVAASSLCTVGFMRLKTQQGLTKPGPRGRELQPGSLPEKSFLDFYSRNIFLLKCRQKLGVGTWGHTHHTNTHACV